MITSIKPICDDRGHPAALVGIDAGPPEHDCLEVLATLVDEYGDSCWQIDRPIRSS